MKKMIKLFSLLLGAGIALSSCSNDKSAKDQITERIENVEVEKLEKQTIARELEFSTTLNPYDKVAIAPALAGRIDQILTDVGTKVSKGQLLVKMDQTNYIKANLEFENLKTDFQRISTLNESNNISKQVYDQTKAQYDVTKASVENLAENTFLKAPFAGVISEKNYENGELFAQMPILTLVQISTLKAFINIPETYFPLVKGGNHINVTSDIYPDKQFNASIEIIYPTIDPNTHTFQVQLKVPNKDELLRPGMFVRTKIQFGEVETLIVPYQSVLKLQGSDNRYVFINNNGTAKRVDVKLGQRFDDKIEIFSDDIKAGDELIVVGQARLVDGSKLNIKKKSEENNK